MERGAVEGKRMHGFLLLRCSGIVGCRSSFFSELFHGSFGSGWMEIVSKCSAVEPVDEVLES